MENIIESTKTVYLDGDKYIRVYIVGCDTFEDIPAESYEDWKLLYGIA